MFSNEKDFSLGRSSPGMEIPLRREGAMWGRLKMRNEKWKMRNEE
jgi:hypothetical protein